MMFEILRELCSFFLYCCATLVGFLSRVNNPKHPKDKTIIIVHGWMGKSLAFLYLKAFLEKHGFSVYFADFGLHINDITVLAKKLHIFIQTNSLKDVYLLGISDGGIICWEYLQQYNAWNNIKKLITVATPFQGSWISGLAIFSKAAQQIAVGSSFVATLNKEEIQFSEKIVSITGTWDEFVLPHATKHSHMRSIVVPEGGHAYLQMFSKKVFEAILKEVS